MQKGLPNRAGFEHGRKTTCFQIGLVLAILKVVFPDLGFSKIGFSSWGLFRISKKGLVSLLAELQTCCLPLVVKAMQE